MSIQIQSQSLSAPSTSTHPTKKGEVEHLIGVLWYEMLSSLNQTGMDENTLGTGGSNYQSMFLWNVAENDFGKYDSKLINDALHQVGGQAGQTASSRSVSDAVSEASNVVQETPIFEEALAAPGTDALASPDLTAQATTFAKSIWPQITQAARALGVPAVAVLAQTALETGWGAAMPGHNLFGIKAADGQSGSMRQTHEVIDGVLTPQTASFRDYSNSSASISDYVSLIQTLYPDALGQNSVSGFAQALQAGGYATDQNYAGKIEQIAQSPLMSQVLQAVGAAQSVNTGVMP